MFPTTGQVRGVAIRDNEGTALYSDALAGPSRWSMLLPSRLERRARIE